MPKEAIGRGLPHPAIDGQASMGSAGLRVIDSAYWLGRDEILNVEVQWHPRMN